MKPDLLDLAIFLGLACLFAGLYLSLGLGWALVGVGLVLLAIAAIALVRRS